MSYFFGHELPWRDIYILLYQVYLDSSVRSVQYSYLMLLITPTNTYLCNNNINHVDLFVLEALFKICGTIYSSI